MSRAKYPPIKSIEATGLPDAWYKLVKTCMNEGAEKKRFYGHPVRTYDIVSLTEIKYPLLEPMLHPGFPTKELHCAEYEKQWERLYDWIKQGFDYNYMDRLINYPTADLACENWVKEKHSGKRYYRLYGQNRIFIDQLKAIKEKIEKRIQIGGECLVSNRDRIITWIPDRDLFVDEDQPCLQSIQFFVYEYPKKEDTFHIPACEITNGKAEFHCVWRSRDGYSAWNTNMIGLIRMLIREVFEPNNLELVKVVDFCNSFHIYEADWQAASKIKPMAINPMLMR